MDRKITSDAGVGTVLFSADGVLLRGLCQDQKLRAWDVASGSLKQTISIDPGETAAVLSAAGLTTFGKDGSIKSWDVATGKVARRVTPRALRERRVAAASDGSFYLGSSGTETKLRAVDPSGKDRFVVPAGLGGAAIGDAGTGGHLHAIDAVGRVGAGEERRE